MTDGSRPVAAQCYGSGRGKILGDGEQSVKIFGGNGQLLYSIVILEVRLFLEEKDSFRIREVLDFVSRHVRFIVSHFDSHHRFLVDFSSGR